ncbi:polyphosphate kinase 2 family protein [Sphingomonas montana]|uniref:polyphosphate kinase 2 family protein n=1 Tax=Sphingomonas montana TaxID=1843236 RepID=UPI00096CD14F|nr:polyphosphate kinase [Sphingomonas montana]
MGIDLSEYETGAKYDGDYEADLATLQERLTRIMVAHIVHKRRSIIVFEGWDAAGKGGAIQRMTAEWDPRYFQVWPIAAPSPEEASRHFLWRFWTRLPAKGRIAVFDRSWYGRVLVERVEGYATEDEWQRAYDEINAFEAQQCADGTKIVKLFLHIDQQEQDERIMRRVRHPWKRWKTGADDFRNRDKRAGYLDAMADMFRHTDTETAPWHVVDAGNKKAARIAALTHVATVLEKHVPMDAPEADPETIALAKAHFGAALKLD